MPSSNFLGSFFSVGLAQKYCINISIPHGSLRPSWSRHILTLRQCAQRSWMPLTLAYLYLYARWVCLWMQRLRTARYIIQKEININFHKRTEICWLCPFFAPHRGTTVSRKLNVYILCNIICYFISYFRIPALFFFVFLLPSAFLILCELRLNYVVRRQIVWTKLEKRTRKVLWGLVGYATCLMSQCCPAFCT